MASDPPGPTERAADQTAVSENEETYCYGHPKTPTKLRCSRCERPICGRCAIPASVGQHCPECVAEAKRSAPKVRTVLRATAPAVFTILAVNIAFFIAQQLFAGSAAPLAGGRPGLTERLWLFSPAIADGEWWRLLTPMFLHARESVWHILLNSFALYSLGSYAEDAFGTARFAVMYLVAGFFGNVVSYAFGACFAPSVGASGAIFGVLGVLLIYAYNRRTSQFMGNMLRQLLLILAINLVLGFSIARINNLAHIGGLVAGASLAVGFDQRRGRPVLSAQVLTAAAVVGAGIVLVIWRTATFTCGAFG